MSIRRAPHQTEYFVIRNAAMRDERLSFKARGILALLLSMPDEWRVTYRWLVERGPDGQTAVLGGLKELEEMGYLRRSRVRDVQGKWVHESVVYESHEQPDLPCVENPRVDDRSVGNRRIEEVPSNEVPIKEIPTSSSRSRAKLEDELFDRFWEVYPRKVAKTAAKKAWDQALKRRIVLNPYLIIAGAERYARECETVESARFIAHPATWLNGDRWLDEPDQDPNLGMLARIVAEERSKHPELNP